MSKRTVSQSGSNCPPKLSSEELSEQFRRSARKYRAIREKLGAAFRVAQEEAYDSWEASLDYDPDKDEEDAS